MLIEIESAFGDRMIWGAPMTLFDLQKQVKLILSQGEERDFVSLLCARLGYEEISTAEGMSADYVIDLDTHRVYVPKYGEE